MHELKFWEDKIKEKRKKTDFRVFVKEIASWSVLNLYKNKGILSKYPDTGRVQVLDNLEAQNASHYFIDYDFNYGFFVNYKKLFEKVPLQYLMDFGNNENSTYTEATFGAKNCYLSFVIGFGVENVFYSAFCYLNSSNIYNGFIVTTNCNIIYFSSGIVNSSNIFYSKYINDSSNIHFSTNLIGCNECIFCNGLQNQKYCFMNKTLEKEEYFKIKISILENKNKYFENYKFISKNEAINYLSKNINGKYNIRCHNVENGYWVTDTQNSRNIINVGGDKIHDLYDSFDSGINSWGFYGVNGAGNNSNDLYCSTQINCSSKLYYSYFLNNCSFCIGCIGLKNKSFCILNKQYTKEDWHIMADKIFVSMDKAGILGDFFPGSLNPFYFNDTMAYLIDDSFSKEEVEKEGYMWREEKIKVDIPSGAEIIYSTEIARKNTSVIASKTNKSREYLISNSIKILDDFQGYNNDGKWIIDKEILEKVIVDENGNYYKIVKIEYDFLMKYGLPLPEIHWLDRIKMGFK